MSNATTPGPSAAPGSASPPPAVVTVVGLGAMGLPMALRLQQAGLTIRGVDVFEGAVARSQQEGLRAGTDLALAAGSDVVLAMVATGPQLLDLVSSDLVISQSLDGAVLVVMSTVGPGVVREAAEHAAPHGVSVVDCPVTGGVTGAEAGALTLFASGAPELVERVSPVLSHLGVVRLVGPAPGDGQSVKLVNQMLASLHLAAAGQAVAFAERLGVDPHVVVDLLPRGAASSWMLADRGPRMLLAPQARPTRTQLAVMAKDASLVVDAVESSGAWAPLARANLEVWRAAAERGLDVGDDSGVVDLFRAGHPPAP